MDIFMSSAVLDLQRAIASGDQPLSQLLRETKLIAAKLNLTDVEQWVDYELNGYSTDVQVPEYRKCRSSHLEIRNPVRGWDHAGMVNRLLDVRQPIGVSAMSPVSKANETCSFTLTIFREKVRP